MLPSSRGLGHPPFTQVTRVRISLGVPNIDVNMYMTYFYLYQTTNLINGKIYIGVHKTSNLEDGYMGSGKVLNYAIEKYGIENFRKDILEFFDTANEMFAREKEIVTEEFLLREDTYNLKHGGHGGFDYVNKVTDSSAKSKAGMLGYEASVRSGKRKQFTREDVLKAVSALKLKRLLDPEFAEQQRINSLTARIKAITPEVKAKRKETYKKIKHQQGAANSQFGTMWVTNGVTNKKIKSTDLIPEGWRKGRKMRL